MIPFFISRYLSILYRHGQRELSAFLREYGLALEVGQFPFLMRVLDQPGVTQERLSCLLGMDKGTVARVVAQLVEQDLIERRVDERDRRVLHLFPTPRAEAMQAGLVTVASTMQERLYQGLDAAERAEAERLILHMVGNLRHGPGDLLPPASKQLKQKDLHE